MMEKQGKKPPFFLHKFDKIEANAEGYKVVRGILILVSVSVLYWDQYFNNGFVRCDTQNLYQYQY